MVNLFITVLAIALAALVVAGGINYLDTDLLIRVDHGNLLQRQHQTYVNGVSSFRTANNGNLPTSLEQLAGFIPKESLPEEPFKWSLVNRTLCVDVLAQETTPKGVLSAFILFSVQKARINAGISPGSTDMAEVELVSDGADCSRVANGTDMIDEADFTVDYVRQKGSVAIIIARY